MGWWDFNAQAPNCCQALLYRAALGNGINQLSSDCEGTINDGWITLYQDRLVTLEQKRGQCSYLSIYLFISLDEKRHLQTS